MHNIFSVPKDKHGFSSNIASIFILRSLEYDKSVGLSAHGEDSFQND